MFAYLDTRDLESELDDLQGRIDEADEALQDEESDGEDLASEDDRERLAALTSLRDDIGSEWRHGVTLIPDSEFEDYAQELASDVGFIDSDSQLYNYIDWSKWARDVQMDYSSVEFDGETYWYRS